MTIMKKVAYIAFFVMLSTSVFSQGEKLKATYLYQFAKILQWPNLGGSFTIGVWGGSKITSILEAVAASKQIGTRPLVIRKISGINDIKGCQILFLAAESKNQLKASLSNSNGQHVLVVTDSPGMIKNGAGINFLMNNGKVHYELSKGNIANQGLVSVQVLEKLAHKVH